MATFGPRRQGNVQLSVLHTGQAVVTLDGESTALRAGEGILLRLGLEEIFQFHGRNGAVHSWCHLPPEFFPGSARLPRSVFGHPVRCRRWLIEFMKNGWRLGG